MTSLTRFGDARVLFLMAAEPEYGPHLQARFTPLITGVGPVESAVVATGLQRCSGAARRRQTLGPNNPESTASTKDAEGWVATGDAGFIEENGQLRIIDRAKDVGKMANGDLFAPKYVENKLKFFPDILEAVVFGNGMDRCTAFINIDLTAVGNWAERNNIAYASYQELAGHPQVLQSIREHVEEVNRSVAEDSMLSGCQIHRFLVLHKELDADDGELTRTRKVRRRIIEEKYADLVTALYDGSETISTETEVTYEDGRKGSIKATLTLCDAAVVPVATNKVAAE